MTQIKFANMDDSNQLMAQAKNIDSWDDSWFGSESDTSRSVVQWYRPIPTGSEMLALRWLSLVVSRLPLIFWGSAAILSLSGPSCSYQTCLSSAVCGNHPFRKLVIPRPSFWPAFKEIVHLQQSTWSLELRWQCCTPYPYRKTPSMLLRSPENTSQRQRYLTFYKGNWLRRREGRKRFRLPLLFRTIYRWPKNQTWLADYHRNRTWLALMYSYVGT